MALLLNIPKLITALEDYGPNFKKHDHPTPQVQTDQIVEPNQNWKKLMEALR